MSLLIILTRSRWKKQLSMILKVHPSYQWILRTHLGFFDTPILSLLSGNRHQSCFHLNKNEINGKPKSNKFCIDDPEIASETKLTIPSSIFKFSIISLISASIDRWLTIAFFTLTSWNRKTLKQWLSLWKAWTCQNIKTKLNRPGKNNPWHLKALWSMNEILQRRDSETIFSNQFSLQKSKF